MTTTSESTDPTTTATTSSPRTRRLRHAATGVTLAIVAAGVGGVAATVPSGAEDAGTDRAAAVLASASEQNGQAKGMGATEVTQELTQRVVRASRSASRAAEVPVKREVMNRASRSGGQVAGREDLGSGDPKTVARAMLPEFGFGADQFGCLESLWEKESGWDPNAANPSSGAYGIPQALPGSKMAGAGSDWQSNPATQIRWGLGYIADRYGSPCGAWGQSQSAGWY